MLVKSGRILYNENICAFWGKQSIYNILKKQEDPKWKKQRSLLKKSSRVSGLR